MAYPDFVKAIPGTLVWRLEVAPASCVWNLGALTATPLLTGLPASTFEHEDRYVHAFKPLARQVSFRS